MRFKKFLALAACALFAGSMRAQTGVYILATGQHVTGVHYNYTLPPSPPSVPTNLSVTSGPYNGYFSPIGYTIGAYHDFLSLGRFHLGADARFISTSAKKGATASSDNPHPFIGAGGRVYSGLAGVRFSTPVKLMAIHLTPYIGANAGLVRTNYGVLYPDSPQAPGTGRLSNLGLNGNIGADIHLAPFVALRLDGSSGIIHGGPVNASYPLQTFSIGINFHSGR